MKKLILKSKNPQFILRHITLADVPAYFESMQDKKTKRGFMNAPKSLNEVRKNISKRIAQMKSKKLKDEVFTIEVNGEFAGFVNLHDMNKEHFEHRAYMGYCLHPKFRGKGIMTSAVKIIRDYAFNKYKLKRLEAICRTFNKSSAKVLEKAGFKLEGILRKNKCKNGKYLDDMVWAIVK